VGDFRSSAHVYLRLLPGQTIEACPPCIIDACAKLTKANSIAGCKERTVAVVYTPASNLKKTGDMAVGTRGSS
jgi:hypothetical protein